MTSIEQAAMMHRQINQDRVILFLKRSFPDAFSLEQLRFWAEVTGYDADELLDHLIKRSGYRRLFHDVYVRNPVESMSEVKELCKLYNISRKDLMGPIVGAFETADGFLFKAIKVLPYSYSVLRLLLMQQNELVPVSSGYWLPAGRVPKPLQLLSRHAAASELFWDELMMSAFVRMDGPLKIESLIFETLSISQAPIALKQLFLFFLEILPVVQVEETDYWVLEKWENRLDIALIGKMYDWLEELPPQPLSEISKAFPDYTIDSLLGTLSFWPEFMQAADGLYGIRTAELDAEVRELIEPELIRTMKAAEEGIPLHQLFQQTRSLLFARGFSMQLRPFKQFLKNWGEAAIVRSKVFAMERAPLLQMRVGDVAYRFLKEFEEPTPYAELKHAILSQRIHNHSISSILLSEPKLSRPSRGYWALKEWGLPTYDPLIHKQIGDVLVSFLTEIGRPVHKSEIRRYLRRRGLKMNEVTLHIDISENPLIDQVARGVYALKSWGLTFRDMFRYNFSFRLALPNGDPKVIEYQNGVLVEYFISKLCLELGRVLLKRHMLPYFPDLTAYLKYEVLDIRKSFFEGWIDSRDDGRYQIMGLERWYKTYRPKYGENMYLFIPNGTQRSLTLLTADQADDFMDEMV